MLIVDDIIRALHLEPLPDEGGFFRETYRSRILADFPGYQRQHATSSAIYYFLTPTSFSAIHRLRSDEIFHFYLGDPCTMLQLHADGTSNRLELGNNLEKGQHLQLVVPAGTWQGLCLAEGGCYALLGTTVSPGFEWDDFELANRNKLIAEYPNEVELINRLTLEN